MKKRVLFPIRSAASGLKAVSIHGHRGARGLCPENTVAAFLKAIALGVHALELDVVISEDHQVVVSHEAWMNAIFCTRPDGKAVEDDPEKYNLYRMPYAEIKTYDCGLRRHPDFPMQQQMRAYKPLLREVIKTIDDYCLTHQLLLPLYNIEIKTELPYGRFNPDPDFFTELVCTELRELQVLGRTHLQSFDTAILQALKSRADIASIGLLVENTNGLEMNLQKLGFLPDVYSPDYTLIEDGLVEKVHRRGMAFIPWTVNEVKDMEKLICSRADGIITDYPDKALQLIHQQTTA